MEINHSFHQHTLFLSEEKVKTPFSCFICKEAIFGLSYCCVICPFVLHKWCAESPLELPKFSLELSKLLHETSELFRELSDLPSDCLHAFPELSELFGRLSEVHFEGLGLLPESQELLLGSSESLGECLKSLCELSNLSSELAEFPEVSELLYMLSELPSQFLELIRKLSKLLFNFSESPHDKLSELFRKVSRWARKTLKLSCLMPDYFPRELLHKLPSEFRELSEFLSELLGSVLELSVLPLELSKVLHELSEIPGESLGLRFKSSGSLSDLSKVPLMFFQMFHEYLDFPGELSPLRRMWLKLSNFPHALSELLHVMWELLCTNNHQTLILSRIESSSNPTLCGICKYPIESLAFAYTSTTTTRSLSTKIHLECTLFPVGRYTEQDGFQLFSLCRIWDEIPKLLERGVRRSYLHTHCTVLPRTIKHSVHLHELTLHQPFEEDPYYFQFICDACEKDRDPASPVYYCEPCKFVAHIGCGIFGSEPPPIQDVLGNHVVYKFMLPESAKEEEEIEEGDDVSEEGDRIEHFSHKHPLSLKSYKRHNKLSPRLCYACRQIIFGMAYSCIEESCQLSSGTFYLHKWCAQLPKMIDYSNHLLHGPLKMMENHLIQNIGFEKFFEKDSALICRLCGMNTIRLSYECEKCNFRIHAFCALLPDDLNHQSHKHTLTIVINTSTKYKDYEVPTYNLPFGSSENPLCQACGFLCQDVSLECKSCDFHLHVHCFLLPYTGKHTTHRHDLNLTYSYEEDPIALEFICDTCEKQRTPNRWVYCCPDTKCNILSLVDCVVPKYFTTFEHKK